MLPTIQKSPMRDTPAARGSVELVHDNDGRRVWLPRVSRRHWIALAVVLGVLLIAAIAVLVIVAGQQPDLNNSSRQYTISPVRP